MIRHNENVRLRLNPFMTMPPAGPYVSPQLERAIAARWRQWVPWVCMYLLRARQSAPTLNTSKDGPESRRLCQLHREHILDMIRHGISMRTVRRYRLDDARITDEGRTMLIEAAKERQSKAWFRRPAELRAEEKLATRVNLGPAVRPAAPKDVNDECPEGCARTADVVPDPMELEPTIDSIRRKVCEHFYLRKMRDPELTVRTNRRSYVLPRQTDK